MLIALLSDIHANAPALEAALAAIRAREVDRTIVVGDIVGDGPFPAETVRMLMAEGKLEAIRGNVDRRVIGLFGRKRKKLEARVESGGRKRRNYAWTALALPDAERTWLAELPTQISFAAEGFEVLIAHGSPLGDDDSIYPSLTEEGLQRKLAPLAEPRPDLLIAGHTHVPFARSYGSAPASAPGESEASSPPDSTPPAQSFGPILVANCGSVGRPVDGDPRGSFAIAEITRANRPRVDLFRFSYDLAALAEAMEERGVPGIEVEEYQQGIKT